MMCTAAVCPISPASAPSTLMRFRQKQDDDFLLDETSNDQTPWRSRNSSKDIPTFWLNLSPMADVIYNSPKLSLLHTSPKHPAKLDFVCKLPVELSLAILQLLSDQDLCNISLVCKEWYRLSLDHPLRMRRKTYIQSQRIIFKQSKENFNNSRNTPPSVTRTRSSASLSPLCPIGNLCSPPAVVETPRQFEYLHSAPVSADSSRFNSSMSSVVDSVERLSIKGGGDTRRCLFPGIDTTPGTRRGSSTVGQSPRQRRQPPYRLVKNKDRLRRL